MMWQEVLDFWFKEAGPEKWFAKSDEFDAQIKQKFEATYWRAVRGETATWREAPEGRLAEVIVLDQFARNMFRDTPQAFAADPLALKLAEEAVAARADTKLSPHQRYFLYMPYMHSEDRAVHKKAVWLFLSLPPWLWWGGLRYEFKHKKIIERFGRYPHRNQVLGRTSTPEEVEFLKTNKGF